MATTKRTRTTKSSKAEKPKATAPEVAKITTEAADMQQAIRRRAYELYLQRGAQDGRDCEDWLRAESEVLERFEAQTA